VRLLQGPSHLGSDFKGLDYAPQTCLSVPFLLFHLALDFVLFETGEFPTLVPSVPSRRKLSRSSRFRTAP